MELFFQILIFCLGLVIVLNIGLGVLRVLQLDLVGALQCLVTCLMISGAGMCIDNLSIALLGEPIFKVENEEPMNADDALLP